jgi:hypothetical protein
VKQDCLMGNTFDAGLSTDKAREAGMTGWWWSLSLRKTMEKRQ